MQLSNFCRKQSVEFRLKYFEESFKILLVKNTVVFDIKIYGKNVLLVLEPSDFHSILTTCCTLI